MSKVIFILQIIIIYLSNTQNNKNYYSACAVFKLQMPQVFSPKIAQTGRVSQKKTSFDRN